MVSKTGTLSAHSRLTFRLLWALPGRSISFLRRLTDWLPHSLEPWKAHKQAVQNWKPQSALLHTPSPFTEWHLAGCSHRGQGLRHSSLKRVLATWEGKKIFEMTNSKCLWTSLSTNPTQKNNNQFIFILKNKIREVQFNGFKTHFKKFFTFAAAAAL